MHEGHRNRLGEKFKRGEQLDNHELLELLLFNAYPRINTNPIAHGLLDRFCTFGELFGATAEEMEEVEGVGASAAAFLTCVGQCFRRTTEDEAPMLMNLNAFKSFLHTRFAGREKEVLELYFLDESGRLRRIYTFTSDDENKVEVPAERIIDLVASIRPKTLLMAHNHVNGGACSPSGNDDAFTKQVQLVCSMNRVKLLDHQIYVDAEHIYSYFDTGRLLDIRKAYAAEGVLKRWIK